MNNKILYAIIGAVVGSLATWLVMSNTTKDQVNMETMTDQQFIEHMIPHHEDAVVMSQLLLKNADHPELQQLAKNIIKSQTQEITQMKNWYKKWYGKDVPLDKDTVNQHGTMKESAEH